MKAILFKAVRSYLAMTLVMVINVGLLLGVLALTVFRHPLMNGLQEWQESSELRPAQGNSAVVEENLTKLSGLAHRGLHADLRAMLRLCGEPDGYMGDINHDLELLYLYNRFGKKDWAAYVTLRNGFFTGVGWNDASVNDHSPYKKWDIQEKDVPTFK